MADLSDLTLKPQNAATIAQTSTQGEVVSVDATLVSAPQKITALTRPVQITGTIVDVSQPAPVSGQIKPVSVSVQTAAGSINLSVIPEQSAEDTKGQLTQILINLVQTKKNVEIDLAPAPSGLVATLKLPTTTPSVPNAPSLAPAPSPIVQSPNAVSIVFATPGTKPEALPVLKEGQTVRALVLPNQIDGNFQALSAEDRSETTPPTQAVKLYAQNAELQSPIQNLPPQQALLNTALSKIPKTDDQMAKATVVLLANNEAAAPDDILEPYLPPLSFTRISPSLTPHVDNEQALPQITQETQSTNSIASSKTPAQTGVETTKTQVSMQSVITNNTMQGTALTQGNTQTGKALTTDNKPLTNTKTQTSLAETPIALSPIQSQEAEATAKLMPPLRAGTDVGLTIKSIVPQNAPMPPLAADEKEATVIGSGPQGQLLINLENNTLILKESVQLPPGTRVVLSLDVSLDDLPVLPALSQHNPSEGIKNLANALETISPTLQAQFFQTHIPQANKILGGTLSFLMCALNKGSAAEWLGNETSDILRKTDKSNLIDSLSDSFEQSTGYGRDYQVGLWRTMTIPLFDHGQFHQLNFFVHNNTHDTKDEATVSVKKRTRFIVNLTPSHLGPMQLDGLVQPKKMDLIIRSKHLLPHALLIELRNLYLKTLGGIDYTGTIGFQTGQQGWIVIRPAAKGQGVTT